MPACPKCAQTQQQIKDGFTPAGSQRYRCKSCGCRYTPEAKDWGYTEETRLVALRLHLEGYSLRAISRSLNVNHQSVANWINDFTTYLPANYEDLIDMARIDGLID
ncbi:MAG: IS1 family transposase [Ardenticatenaceae bacterium]|nr:IS1 family transposase [Ardenticatenaceae bacterium]